MTLSFHFSGDAKNGKEERHSRFRAMIFLDNVRRLLLKIAELEGIDAPAGPLKIVAFLAAVPTVVFWGMHWASAQNAPE